MTALLGCLHFMSVMGKDMQVLYDDVWSNLTQGVLVVATKENGNHRVQEGIGLAGQHWHIR